jgi:hypothetical protein
VPHKQGFWLGCWQICLPGASISGYACAGRHRSCHGPRTGQTEAEQVVPVTLS